MFGSSIRKTSDPWPEPPAEEEPREAAARRPTREAAVFAPSSFAARRAERRARGVPDKLPQRLVSLGRTVVLHSSFGVKGTNSYRPPSEETVELLVDADHPAQQYVRYPGTAPQPLVTRHVEPDRVEPLGFYPRNVPHRPVAWPAADPELPPRPI